MIDDGGIRFNEELGKEHLGRTGFQTISFKPFNGTIFTTFLAGFA